MSRNCPPPAVQLPIRKINKGKPLTEGTFRNSKCIPPIPPTVEYVGGGKKEKSQENHTKSLILFSVGCIVGSLFAIVFN